MLAAGSVGSNQLANGAVTAAKMVTTSNWFALTIPNPTPVSFDVFELVRGSHGKRPIHNRRAEGRFYFRSRVVHLYEADGTLVTTFFRNDLPTGDLFGSAVARLGGDRVIIGSPV